MPLSQDRLSALKLIKQYENESRFDEDVENDPPTVTLNPEDVDYLNKKLSSRILSSIATSIAKRFINKLIRQKKLIIENVYGLENYDAIKDSGAFITCNHFNQKDNFALHKVFEKQLRKKRLYKVIREGNFNAFKGLFGMFFRHCNTLPLSQNRKTMAKFLSALSTLIQRKEKILIYPEQAMWWNYKKPRPLKNGAFKFAVINNAPVLPCFITFRDSDILEDNGSYVQMYTIWIFPAIYPNTSVSVKEATEMMKNQNYQLWKNKYEEVYKIKLEY